MELYKYWNIEPPTHVLVGLWLEYKPGIQESGSARGLTDADRDFLAKTSRAPAKTYDNLPPHVQAWLQKTKQEAVN